MLLSRIVGIDYGTKRSGIAATDILQIAVHGVDTVPTGTLWDWLEAYIKKEEVEKIVIGHPTHADGNAVSFMNQIIGLERKIKKLIHTLLLYCMMKPLVLCELSKSFWLPELARKKKRQIFSG